MSGRQNIKMQLTLFLSLLVITTSAFYNNEDQVGYDLETLDWNSGPDYVDWRGPLLVNKMWNALIKEQKNDMESGMDGNLISDVDVKEPNTKRFTNSVKQQLNSYKMPFVIPQRKWNIKKGKGYPSMCYFKLCSFKTLKL